MEVNGKEINIDNLFDQIDIKNNFRINRGNDIYLSNNQISVLERNKIDYKKYSSLSSLIFDIEECLNSETLVDEELDSLLADLSELNYYKNTKK
ncbi:MAG: hypothetical protein HFI86_06000 [Bacilli bacterium]|nr:hypothetical protein [Bacilli bacterium]MCI9434802.1 hypothetical protein [Bacilli bacterium]